MDIEMIIPEEVNNTNILSEEALNPQDALSDELSQDDDVKQFLELSKERFHEQLKKASTPGRVNFLVCKQLGGQSDKLPGHDYFKLWLELHKKWFHEQLKKEQQATPGRVNNLWEYDENFSPAEKTLVFTEFLSFILQSVFRIPGHFLSALLVLISSMIKYRAHMFTTEFVSKLGTQSPLSMGEAFTMFFPQITDIMTIMLCYVLMLWLVCPLPPVLQMFFLLMLIATPCYYIPQVMGMASRTDVTCGFFNLPHIWFTILGGLVLSLISVSLSLLVMYLIKRFIHPGPGGPTVKQFKVSLDAFSDVADMV